MSTGERNDRTAQINDQVLERIQDFALQRQNSIRAIQENRPFDAEPDIERKQARIRSITHCDPPAAAAMARNADPNQFELFGDKLLSAERVQGKTRDFVGVSFLEMAVKAARTVARISLRNGSPWGSGFMISDRPYVADTEKGSSGSPVFNDQWEAIALHHWGTPHRETSDASGKPISMMVNEGIRISSIVQELRERHASLAADQQKLVDVVLESGSFPQPIISPIDETSNGQPVITHTPPNQNTPSTTHQIGGHVTKVDSDGRVTFTLPLEITVGLGALASTAIARSADDIAAAINRPARHDRGESERIVIDRNYNNRHGYDQEFLPAHTVHLPRMLKKLEREAAPLIDLRGDDLAFDLPYENFSIVMHAKRKMAIFTAVNIDGATWINIVRDTGLPKSASEASEKWFDDPRIAAEHQNNQSLHDRQRPQRIFDRGHLVRRQDPAFGNDASAIRANADTFHFTNCTPQFHRFNQRSEFWQGIENYVLNSAKDDNVRIAVFTGPVFGTDDPVFRDVRVPLKFWKVVARVEDDRLLATAFLADQSEMVLSVIDDMESAFRDDLPKVDEYQTSLQEIEQLTGLRFDDLKGHDTFRGGSSESAGDRRRLTRFGDVDWD